MTDARVFFDHLKPGDKFVDTRFSQVYVKLDGVSFQQIVGTNRVGNPIERKWIFYDDTLVQIGTSET